MATRKVVWSRSAYLQRKEILSYWVRKNKSNTYSIKLLKKTRAYTNQLVQSPNLGRPTDVLNVRVYIMGDYNLYYSFTKNEIQVVCFWDNRQNPELLLNLLSTI